VVYEGTAPAAQGATPCPPAFLCAPIRDVVSAKKKSLQTVPGAWSEGRGKEGVGKADWRKKKSLQTVPGAWSEGRGKKGVGKADWRKKKSLHAVPGRWM
jgi:hypothetical protein